MRNLKRFRNWIALVAKVSWNYLRQLSAVRPTVAEESPDEHISQVSSSARVIAKPESQPAATPVAAPVITPKPEHKPAPITAPVPANNAPPRTTTVDVVVTPKVKPVDAAAPTKSAATELPWKAPAIKPSADLPSTNGKHQQPPMSEQSAQRLARVLISEIKLYYMSKMEGQDGADVQNIYDLLKDPIDKSRKHYKQRVGNEASMPDYFHGELVRALCEGDESRLGPNYNNK